MTIPPIIIPEQQFNDADGHPYAGGSLATYIPGTTTPKQTWLDPGQAALNTNPIILDAAGRCLLYGDGDYRLILRDAAGNLIWDIPATTLVSAAMYPVVSAPTIADAVHLLGLDNTVTAAALASAINAEQAARIAADNTLQAHIDSEASRAVTAEDNLQNQINSLYTFVHGTAGPPLIQRARDITDSDGHKRVTFPVAFSAEPAVVAVEQGASYDLLSATITADTTGFDIWLAFPLTSGITPAGARPFYWIAAGAA